MRFDLYLFIPEIFITCWLVYLLLHFTLLTRRRYIFTFKNIKKTYVINPIPAITAFLLVLSISYFFLQITGYSSYSSLSGLTCTPTLFYIKILLSFIFILYFIYLRTNMQTLVFYSFEFYIILFFAFISLNFLLISNNFLNIFLFIEIYSMCIYYLIASKKNSVKSIESAIKYFIFGSFSSAFLLFGMFLVYYSTGSINLIDISHLTFQNSYFKENLIYITGSYFICFSLLIKMGASLFFFWIVEIYDGVSFNLLIFLNIFPKIIYLLILFNFVNSFNLFYLALIVKTFVVSSLLIGLLGALTETKVKRFLVFTSIYNLSFFSIPFWSLHIQFIGIFIFFSSVYLLNFFVFMILFSNLRDMRTNIISKNLIDLHEIKAQNPKLGWLFIFFAFFSSGLPLTIIFMVKFSFFFEFSRLTCIAALVYFLFLSSLSFFYYLRIIKLITQGTPYPNILIQPICLVSSLIYSCVIWFNLYIIIFLDKILLLLNYFLINVV